MLCEIFNLHSIAEGPQSGTATDVPQNLRGRQQRVELPDLYDPGVNPLYRDMLTHYGVVAMTCRIQDPDRKGKESCVGQAQKTTLKGQRFESLGAAQSLSRSFGRARG
jgi:hypothetical protein